MGECLSKRYPCLSVIHTKEQVNVKVKVKLKKQVFPHGVQRQNFVRKSEGQMMWYREKKRRNRSSANLHNHMFKIFRKWKHILVKRKMKRGREKMGKIFRINRNRVNKYQWRQWRKKQKVVKQYIEMKNYKRKIKFQIVS